MAKVVKAYKEHHPPRTLIGKRYMDSDRGPDGSFSNVWNQWFANGDFEVLKQIDAEWQYGTEENEIAGEPTYVAYMRFVDDTFEYWVGMLFPEGIPVPDGYMSVDLGATNFGICWIHGHDETGELYGPDAFEMCLGEIRKLGGEMADNGWCFERYHPFRFRTPDEAGKVILDFGIELKS